MRSTKAELDGTNTRLTNAKQQIVQLKKAIKELERIHNKRQKNLEDEFAEKRRLKENAYRNDEIKIKKDFDSRIAIMRKTYVVEMESMEDRFKKTSLQVKDLQTARGDLSDKLRGLDGEVEQVNGALAQPYKHMEEAEARLKDNPKLAAIAKLVRSPNEGQPRQSVLEAAMSILAVLLLYVRNHPETLEFSTRLEMEEQLMSWYNILFEETRVAG